MPDIKSEVFYLAADLSEISGCIGISYLQIGSVKSGDALQILHESYHTNADTGMIMLSNEDEDEEGGVILSGKLGVTVGAAKRILSVGDAYYFNSRELHRFKNVGSKISTVVCAFRPSTF